MTPDERDRIATTCGVTVPDSVTVQIVPRGASGESESLHWREGRNASYQALARQRKFARAAKRVVQ
jgi:hypothetical protein